MTVEDQIPDDMLAVVAEGTGFENLAVRRVPVPRPGPDQLLARVDAAGVCTSILKLVSQGPEHPYLNGWDLSKWPVILGDEGSITLVAVGDNLRGEYTPGERYVIQPAVDIAPINHRERYRDGARGMHKCAVGYTLQGNLAQYILVQEEVIEAQCLLPVPDVEMPCFAASMAEPISCVLSAQQRNVHLLKDGPLSERRPHMGLLPGGVTLVCGAGAMGRMHAELALRYRPRVLIVSDIQKERLDRTAKTLAAKAASAGTRMVCASAADLDTTLMQESDGRGADDLILALGVRSVQQRSLGLLAPGGVANLFGGLPKGDDVLDLNARDVHYREIKVVGSSGGEPSDMAATLAAVADGDIDPGNYVAAVGSLDCAVDVLKLIQDTRIDGKAILYPGVQPTELRRVEGWSGDQEKAFLHERAGNAS
jgi:threonine dehydrogenase-like Zn-dependent dehydrogenase